MDELRILDEAAQEVDAAAAYLEEERAGYGLLFIDAYQQRLAQIARFPALGPPLRDAPPGYELRSVWIRQFGYSIIVAVLEGYPTIIAVMHHSREPGYWRDRLG